MKHTGLVSVTFRKLKPAEIVMLVKEAGLESIEWGGDIHVPHGALKQAGEVYNMTMDAGLHIASYGSYYKAGSPDENQVDIESILETALALHAPNVRIWAGNCGSGGAGGEIWHRVVEDSIRAAGLAKKAGVTLSFEYHGGTLTDTPESTLKLMHLVGHPNLFTYWQPNYALPLDKRIESLRMILPWLSNIHMFYWKDGNRLPLIEGESELKSCLELIPDSQKKRYIMLEFVRDDDPGQFIQDAAALKKMLELESN